MPAQPSLKGYPQFRATGIAPVLSDCLSRQSPVASRQSPVASRVISHCVTRVTRKTHHINHIMGWVGTVRS